MGYGGVLDTFATQLIGSLPQYMTKVMIVAFGVLFLLLAFAAPLHKRYHFTKKHFYTTITAIIFSVTVALIVGNIVLITNSSQNGLSRRYGSIYVSACGQSVEILPQNRYSASAGNGTYTINTDGTMQYLGYMQPGTYDASLGSFFNGIGGALSANVVTLPLGAKQQREIDSSLQLSQFVKSNILGESYLELRSGEACTLAPSMVNIYVYSYTASSDSYERAKLTQHPENYVLSDQTFAHRDCVVVFFGEPREAGGIDCQGYPGVNTSASKEVSL